MKALNSLLFTVLLMTSAAISAGEVTTSGSDLVINMKGPIEIKTADGDYSAKLGGRIQWDYNYAELNGEADEDDLGIRRARLYLSGNVEDWSYKIQFNVGNGKGGTHEDLYIRYNGWGKKAIVTVGNQKEPFGLEEMESSKDIAFLERAAITEAFAPNRSEGVQFSGQQGSVTYAVGVFEDDDVTNNGTAVTGRVTYAPIHSNDQVLHLGLAHTNRSSDIDATGVELGYVQGPYYFQSEYMSSDNAGATRSGYYVQAGWILTGESRPYKKGVFKRIKPKGSAGAWELVARYEDGDGNYADEELGNTDATSYGIGINYYLNKYIRIGADYTEAEDNFSNDEGSEFRARLQIAL